MSIQAIDLHYPNNEASTLKSKSDLLIFALGVALAATCSAKAYGSKDFERELMMNKLMAASLQNAREIAYDRIEIVHIQKKLGIVPTFDESKLRTSIVDLQVEIDKAVAREKYALPGFAKPIPE